MININSKLKKKLHSNISSKNNEELLAAELKNL